MAVSYEQAREIARDYCQHDWDLGTFCLDDRVIVENDDFYVFSVGAREFLVDGDASYATYDGVPVVHKHDGRLEWLPSAALVQDGTIRSQDNPTPTVRV